MTARKPVVRRSSSITTETGAVAVEAVPGDGEQDRPADGGDAEPHRLLQPERKKDHRCIFMSQRTATREATRTGRAARMSGIHSAGACLEADHGGQHVRERRGQRVERHQCRKPSRRPAFYPFHVLAFPPPRPRVYPSPGPLGEHPCPNTRVLRGPEVIPGHAHRGRGILHQASGALPDDLDHEILLPVAQAARRGRQSPAGRGRPPPRRRTGRTLRRAAGGAWASTPAALDVFRGERLDDLVARRPEWPLVTRKQESHRLCAPNGASGMGSRPGRSAKASRYLSKTARRCVTRLSRTSSCPRPMPARTFDIR